MTLSKEAESALLAVAERPEILDYGTPLPVRELVMSGLVGVDGITSYGELLVPYIRRERERQAGEHKTSHHWVPVAECGELADGSYIVRETGWAGSQERLYTSAGGWFTGGAVTHVLSPHLGPIPEAPCT